MLFQPPLPPAYTSMTPDEMRDRIRDVKARLGRRLVILGHHYQQDDVIAFADFTGDSLKLSQLGAKQRDAEYIVFCGVHFMAETADVLTDDSVTVILPDLSAGCSMADMADIDDLEDAWDFLTDATDAKIIPITYVNSSAAIKAFCGAHDGACCTSSNAKLVLQWALEQGDKVIFLPDQHLGRNTAYALGFPLDSMVVYDPRRANGGLTAGQADDATFILWKGHCSVHGLFTAAQCDAIRQADAEYKVLVHPEVPWDVVQKADLAGSTEYIIRTVQSAPPGSKWAIGTEMHLVNRLAMQHPEQMIRSLAGIHCMCTTMYRVDLLHLTWSLDQLARGRIVNPITVPPDIRRDALLALDRMLSNVSTQPVAAK